MTHWSTCEQGRLCVSAWRAIAHALPYVSACVCATACYAVIIATGTSAKVVYICTYANLQTLIFLSQVSLHTPHTQTNHIHVHARALAQVCKCACMHGSVSSCARGHTPSFHMFPGVRLWLQVVVQVEARCGSQIDGSGGWTRRLSDCAYHTLDSILGLWLFAVGAWHICVRGCVCMNNP